MGVTDSKEMAQTVFRACSDAERSGKNDIKAVLSDPKVLSLLHNLWSNLSDVAKSKIDPGMTRKNTSSRPENGRPKKVRKLKVPDSEFTLGPDFMIKVSDWLEDPLSFFNEGESQLDLTGYPFEGMDAYMNSVTKRTGIDTIRLRLLKVMYHRLSGHVGWTQLRQKRTERMAQLASNSSLSAWVNEGHRIDKLCRDIGCVERVDRTDQYFHLGNLFYSLQDVADYCIKELPLNGSPRPEEIARLRKRSSLSKPEDRKKLESLAHKLTDKIWSAFQNAESGLDSERSPVGFSLGQDAQPPSQSVHSSQQDKTPEEAVLGAGFAVCPTEVATLGHGNISRDENGQPTLLQSVVDGSVMHEAAHSLPQPTTQAHWTNSASSQPTNRPASLRPSSLSDFTDPTPSSIDRIHPAFFGSTSLYPTSVSDFFPTNSPSSVQDAHFRSCHPTSICPSSVSDFTTQALPTTQDIALNALSLYPTSYSDFTITAPTMQSLRPDLSSDFTQVASSQLSVNPTSLDALIRTSQALHTDITESSPQIVDPVRGLTPVISSMYGEQSTAPPDMAPLQILSG